MLCLQHGVCVAHHLLCTRRTPALFAQAHTGYLYLVVTQIVTHVSLLIQSLILGVGKMTWLIDFEGYSLRNAPAVRVSMGVLNILQVRVCFCVCMCSTHVCHVYVCVSCPVLSCPAFIAFIVLLLCALSLCVSTRRRTCPYNNNNSK